MPNEDRCRFMPRIHHFNMQTAWVIKAMSYKTDREKLLYLTTIFKYALKKEIPPVAFVDPFDSDLTDDELIIRAAYNDCADWVEHCVAWQEKSRKGGRQRICTASNDIKEQNTVSNEQPIENQDPLIPTKADLVGQIDPSANIRCDGIEELKGWFDRFKRNANPIRLPRFTGSEYEWNELFEYLERNSWKKAGKPIVYNSFATAVKWAWQWVEDNKIKSGKGKPATSQLLSSEATPDPDELSRHEAAEKKRIMANIAARNENPS